MALAAPATGAPQCLSVMTQWFVLCRLAPNGQAPRVRLVGSSKQSRACFLLSVVRAPAVLTARVFPCRFMGRTCQSEGARKLTADTAQLPLSGRRGAGLRCGLGGMPWHPAVLQGAGAIHFLLRSPLFRAGSSENR